MNLNIETNEYVADYMDAFGLRLVIHEPGTFPFPEEEGFTLNPRYETTIGMRLVSFDIFFIIHKFLIHFYSVRPQTKSI